jgi:hypothetical protein
VYGLLVLGRNTNEPTFHTAAWSKYRSRDGTLQFVSRCQHKENGIKILARSKLHRGSYEIIDALLKVVDAHQKMRDKLAHWYWGISDQITDGLVLIDPKDLLIHDARIMDMHLRADQPTSDDRRLPLDRIYVYRTKDLQADAKAFIELAALVNKCHRLCLLGQSQRSWRLRDELLRDERLASRLVRRGARSSAQSRGDRGKAREDGLG